MKGQRKERRRRVLNEALVALQGRTIEALQAELQEQRRVVNAAEVIIANADGHPAMCCGKCSSAIAKAEAEVTTLRTALERIAQSAKALRYASIEDKALEALHGRE